MEKKEKKTEPATSFEHYMAQLEKILTDMDNPSGSSLDTYIDNFQKGTELIEKCESILKNATLRVQKINERLSKVSQDE
jgi:exodeoxyribonuclease VII small subunit